MRPALMRNTLTSVVLTATLLSAAAAHAQRTATPAEQSSARNTSPGAPTPAVPSAPSPPPGYRYEADSRRDPFLSLLNSEEETKARAGKSLRPPGVAGIAVDEVVVRGLLQSRSGWVAMIAAPDGRTYRIREGDRLLNGRVRTITADSVVLLQEGKDSLSQVTERAVRKGLRGDAK